MCRWKHCELLSSLVYIDALLIASSSFNLIVLKGSTSRHFNVKTCLLIHTALHNIWTVPEYIIITAYYKFSTCIVYRWTHLLLKEWGTLHSYQTTKYWEETLWSWRGGVGCEWVDLQCTWDTCNLQLQKSTITCQEFFRDFSRNFQVRSILKPCASGNMDSRENYQLQCATHSKKFICCSYFFL